MTPRLASTNDSGSLDLTRDRLEGDDGHAVVQEISEPARPLILGRFAVGDLIRARGYPSIQGVVLGKTRGKDAFRVVLTPYSTATINVAAVVVDVPLGIIPPQSLPISFTFWNPLAVQRCVQYLASKGPIRREHEALLVEWINRKDAPEDSVFSASSDFTPATSPGSVRARVQECERALSEQSSSSSSAVSQRLLPLSLDPIAAHEMPDGRSDIRTRSADTKAKEHSDTVSPGTACTMPPASSSSSTMTLTQVSDGQLQELRTEIRLQLKELHDLVSALARRQQTLEDRLNEPAPASSQWEALDLRVNTMNQAESAPKTRTRTVVPLSDDAADDWALREPQKEDTDWQVMRKQGERVVMDAAEELLECPFSLQVRRIDGYRVPRGHRRAHRRFLEEVYGAHDTAVAAAHDVLGHMEKDVHAPSWEVASLLNAARGLDIVLLEHRSGMWAQWNEPIVDYLARFFFEMLARVRPDEDVVQLMHPELQKKLRDFNFGKQRAYGPVAWQARPSKGWRNSGFTSPQPDTAKSGPKEPSFQSRRNQWAGADKAGDSNSSSPEQISGSGAWVWQPGPPPGKPPAYFRPEPPPPQHGPSNARAPQ